MDKLDKIFCKILKVLQISKSKIQYDNKNLTVFIDNGRETEKIQFIVKNGKLKQCNVVPLDDHLYRLLKGNNLVELSGEEIVYDCIEFINNIENIYEYCTICSKNIVSIGKISGCKKCFNNLCQCVTDDIIKNTYDDDTIVFNMIALTAYSCLKHPKRVEIFKPFPACFDSMTDIDNKLKYKYENFNSLISVIDKAKDDYAIYEIIGEYDYYFLKFIIMTNVTDLKSDTLFQESKNIFEKKVVKNVFESHDIMTLKTRHHPTSEERFNVSHPKYVFHGSTLSNWYSIIRNGLKNHSGTGLMAHGAAHGNGIYFADNAQTSFGYAADKYCASGLNVVGVFQVINDDKYSKGGGIYVVPNENDVLMRYAIILNLNNKTSSGKDISFITQHFAVTL